MTITQKRLELNGIHEVLAEEIKGSSNDIQGTRIILKLPKHFGILKESH